MLIADILCFVVVMIFTTFVVLTSFATIMERGELFFGLEFSIAFFLTLNCVYFHFLILLDTGSKIRKTLNEKLKNKRW